MDVPIWTMFQSWLLDDDYFKDKNDENDDVPVYINAYINQLH